MNNSIESVLTKIVADIAIFCEFTGPDLLNEDAAVGMLEQLSAHLNDLDDQDKFRLKSHFKLLSSSRPDVKHAQFIGSLPESLGLTE